VQDRQLAGRHSADEPPITTTHHAAAATTTMVVRDARAMTFGETVPPDACRSRLPPANQPSTKYQLSLIEPRDRIELYTHSLTITCDKLQRSSVGAWDTVNLDDRRRSSS